MTEASRKPSLFMQRRLAAAAEVDALPLKHKEQPQADLAQSVLGIGRELEETVKTSALVRIETTENGRRMIAEQSIPMGTGSVYKCVHRNHAAGKFARFELVLAVFMRVRVFFGIFVNAFFLYCVLYVMCVYLRVRSCMIQSCFPRMRFCL